MNIKEPRSSLEDINLSASDFPNVKSHFGDLSKEESGTKSGVMPSWKIKMPSLKLTPEHFMINEEPRNFVKEHFEKALKGNEEEESKETKQYKQEPGKKI